MIEVKRSKYGYSIAQIAYAFIIEGLDEKFVPARKIGEIYEGDETLAEKEKKMIALADEYRVELRFVD